jgi:pyrroloquinoline quinone biosynthesis protein E
MSQTAIKPPFWLLAELTYRCPLHCVFCYNPVNYTDTPKELATQDWVRVFRQARELGAAQLGFSGGEPLLRDDLEVLVAQARELGFYTNLITSGVGLNEERVASLKQAGLDHIQLSFQDSSKEMNDFLSSTKTFDLKKKVAGLIKQYDYPMVMNVVLHRHNIPHIDKIIDMGLELGAQCIELANTQYYGWALKNRDQLLPTQAQIAQAEATVSTYRKKIGKTCKLLFVTPDYFEQRPKACMNGWGSVFLGIAPDGAALPCHNARELPGLDIPNVKDFSIREIWQDSKAFNFFRGLDWMQEPCRSCPEKEKDFGGCRCQAYLLTGDAAAADPVCSKSPQHQIIAQAINQAQVSQLASQKTEHPLLFRTDKNSRDLTGCN